jgi:hypothetical protein
MICAIATLALVSSAACAGRTDTATTSPTTGATASASNGAEAQAATRLTPQDLESRMKNIGTTFPSMRMHIMANQLDEAAKEAEQLAIWFGDVERFWAQQSKGDAVKWAQEARTLTTEVSAAATAKDAMKAGQAATNMQGTCKQCHGNYREADPAGGFRIKAGVIN